MRDVQTASTKEPMTTKDVSGVMKPTEATVRRKRRKSSMTEPTQIPGFSDYGATRDGEIFSRKVGGKWRKLALHTKGKGGDYLKVKLYSGRGEYTQIAVHTLIALTFIGPKPSEREGIRMQVMHKDFNGQNNAKRNLAWVTHLQSHRHAVRGGHYPKKLTEEQRLIRCRERDKRRRAARRNGAPPRLLVGVQKTNHKLTEKDVVCIRWGAQRLSFSMLSRAFHVSKATIHRIVKRLKWKHL